MGRGVSGAFPQPRAPLQQRGETGGGGSNQRNGGGGGETGVREGQSKE